MAYRSLPPSFETGSLTESHTKLEANQAPGSPYQSVPNSTEVTVHGHTQLSKATLNAFSTRLATTP